MDKHCVYQMIKIEHKAFSQYLDTTHCQKYFGDCSP